MSEKRRDRRNRMLRDGEYQRKDGMYRFRFCSNMAKSGMNPKTLQYIMGHADISVTLNTYTHLKFDDAKHELLRIGSG